MAQQIIYSARALLDLERVEDVAAGAIELIAATVAMLETSPLLGRAVEDGLRELVVSRGKSGYIVLYRFDEARNQIRILGIRHQREVWHE